MIFLKETRASGRFCSLSCGCVRDLVYSQGRSITFSCQGTLLEAITLAHLQEKEETGEAFSFVKVIFVDNC